MKAGAQPLAPALARVARWLAIDGGRAQSILRGSVAAVAPAVALFALLVAMDIDSLRAPPRALDAAFVAYALLVAPAIETAVMLALAAVMAFAAPRQLVLRIVAVALIGAWAHRLGGDWRQAVRTVWPMLVYASVLVLWLRRSALDAFIVTSAVHAVYNASFFAVGTLGALAAGEN